MGVHAFIHSNLDYCNSLLYGLPKYLTNKLQKIQNAAARLIKKKSKFEHITPVLRELHWLPVEQRSAFKIGVLTYKALHGESPQYLRDIIHRYTPTRTLRSSSRNELQIPKMKKHVHSKRAFSFSAPEFWNDLPENIKNSSSLAIFIKNLKTFLFNKAYDC